MHEWKYIKNILWHGLWQDKFFIDIYFNVLITSCIIQRVERISRNSLIKTQLLHLATILKDVKDDLEKATPCDKKVLSLIQTLISERQKQSITQKELAAKANLSINTISRIETFTTIPTLSVLIQIADVLNLDLILTSKE